MNAGVRSGLQIPREKTKRVSVAAVLLNRFFQAYCPFVPTSALHSPPPATNAFKLAYEQPSPRDKRICVD